MKKIISFVCYGAAAALTVFILYIQCGINVIISWVGLLLALILISGILITGTLFRISGLNDPAKKHHTVYITLWIIFIFYIAFLVYLLFLDNTFGRTIQEDHSNYYWYFKFRTNFIPFRMISEYIRNLKHGAVKYAVINLFGNLAAFMPMAFFMPMLFKTMRKPIPFMIFILSALVLVEGTQFLLMVGICDIDDIILNFTGSMIIYIILKLTIFRKQLKTFLN